MVVSLRQRRRDEVEQCRKIYEIYRRHYGVVKSLSLTTKKVREVMTLSDETAKEIVQEMWSSHARNIGLLET